MNSIAFIPARGGSKGVPRKALRTLGDRPLIAYTIRDALAIEGVSKVFVSTDDPEIREVSLAHGAEVPFLRPPELARDDSRLEDAIRHAYAWYRKHEGFERDVEILLGPTHPFRRRDRINAALRRGLADPGIFNIGAIAPARVRLDNYWHFEQGAIHPFPMPEAPRATPGPFYQACMSFNIVFVCRRHLQGRRVPVVLDELESIDIDTPEDLALARQVVRDGWYPFD